jgi:hypothetical protein
VGNYTAKLVVTDKLGLTSTAYKDFSVTPSHKECTTSGGLKYCTVVSGSGSDSCATDTDCRTIVSILSNLSVVPVNCPAAVKFEWTYNDAGGKAQSAYEIQADDDPAFSSPTLSFKNNQVVSSGTRTSTFAIPIVSNDYSSVIDITQKTTFHWRLRVQNSSGTWSSWVNGLDFKTQLHQDPLGNFNWAYYPGSGFGEEYPVPVGAKLTLRSQLPPEESVGSLIIFYDAICRLNPYDSRCRYTWTLPPGAQFVDGTDSHSVNPVVTFSVEGENPVSFNFKDSDGMNCSVQRSVIVGGNLANQAPVATFSCSPSGCTVAKGTALTLVNNSTDPDGNDDIKVSIWSYKKASDPDVPASYTDIPYCPSGSCLPEPGIWNALAPTGTVGDYTAKLVVYDVGLSSTAYKDFSITSSGTTPATVSASITCNPASCSVFSGESLTLINGSTSVPANQIGTSEWYFRSTSGSYPGTPNSSCVLCNSVPQNFVSGTGTFEAKLIVKDTANTDSDTATKLFTIKEGAKADFACKIDNGAWVACNTIKQIAAGQKITFKDDSGTDGIHHSIPSSGGTLGTRNWEIKGVAKTGTGLNNATYVYTAASTEVGNFSIKMTVNDSNQGLISKTYDLKLIPPPIWIEI